MKKLVCIRIIAVAAIITSLGLAFTGCPNPAGGGDSGGSVEPMPYPRQPKPETPSVDGVVILKAVISNPPTTVDNPVTISALNGTVAFTAEVSVSSDPENTLDTGVVWSVTGGSDSTFSGDTLTIGASEAIGTVLTVTAKSIADSSKSATVKVIISPLSITAPSSHPWTALSLGELQTLTLDPDNLTFTLKNGDTASSHGPLTVSKTYTTAGDEQYLDVDTTAIDGASLGAGASVNFTVTIDELGILPRDELYELKIRIEESADVYAEYTIKLTYAKKIEAKIADAATVGTASNPVTVTLSADETITTDPLIIPTGVILVIPDGKTLTLAALQIEADGKVQVVGGLAPSDAITVAGELDIASLVATPLSLDQTITVSSGGTLTISGNLTTTTGGDITVDGGALNITGSATIATDVTIKGPADIGGTVTVAAGGSLIKDTGGTIDTTGTITVEATGIIQDKVSSTGIEFWENAGAGSIELEATAQAKYGSGTDVLVGTTGCLLVPTSPAIVTLKDGDIAIAGGVVTVADDFSTTTNLTLAATADLTITADKVLTISTGNTLTGATGAKITITGGTTTAVVYTDVPAEFGGGAAVSTTTIYQKSASGWIN